MCVLFVVSCFSSCALRRLLYDVCYVMRLFVVRRVLLVVRFATLLFVVLLFVVCGYCSLCVVVVCCLLFVVDHCCFVSVRLSSVRCYV